MEIPTLSDRTDFSWLLSVVFFVKHCGVEHTVGMRNGDFINKLQVIKSTMARFTSLDAFQVRNTVCPFVPSRHTNPPARGPHGSVRFSKEEVCNGLSSTSPYLLVSFHQAKMMFATLITVLGVLSESSKTENVQANLDVFVTGAHGHE